MVSSSNRFTKVTKLAQQWMRLVECENRIIPHYMNPVEQIYSLNNAFSFLFYLSYVSLKSIQTTPYKFPSGCQSNSTNVMYSYSLHTKLVDKKQKTMEPPYGSGHSEVDRCRTRGESEESVACRRQSNPASDPLWLLKQGTDITRNPKQLPHKKVWCRLKTL